MRALLVSLAACVALSAPLKAQGLRDDINQLFIFGPGEDPLFLAGTAGNPNAAVALHGSHFEPSAATQNGTIINFLTNAVGGNVADFPFSSASGGTTFRFEGGTPVPTSISTGPVFAERGQTLGAGRMLVGFTYNTFRYSSIRGVDLHNVNLVFTHVNVTGPKCDSIVGKSCTPYGVPTLENDIMPFNLSLDISVQLASFTFTYGISDRVDFGVAIPLVTTSLVGQSQANIIPFGGDSAFHYFAGTATNPVLSASRFVQGQATGLGDVAVRMKVNVHNSDKSSVALLADARFPTGSEQDLLGAGHFSGRVVAVVSARFDAFSPHADVGYLRRVGSFRSDAVIATVGFDHLMAPAVTMAADIISQLQVGNNKLLIPTSVTYDQPFVRTVRTSEIPNIRDDLINGSFGFKFTIAGGPTVITNALFPLNRGGLRPDVLYTVGLEYGF
ncbi:MAG TPA: hypothetical protein VEH62_08715 [Gemmatimonadales bacterium]|nr:hypothetical protein [Gemmatimonadales bacterium]